ncbi:uncharacterized protein METZ01_LOCUS189463 [marine metagenome]|uniref:Uncharacterized protein n=1 Tax=marine metagenome TaxID=408172 RepID=A0A382DEN7_9ZZZZ
MMLLELLQTETVTTKILPVASYDGGRYFFLFFSPAEQNRVGW